MTGWRAPVKKGVDCVSVFGFLLIVIDGCLRRGHCLRTLTGRVIGRDFAGEVPPCLIEGIDHGRRRSRWRYVSRLGDLLDRVHSVDFVVPLVPGVEHPPSRDQYEVPGVEVAIAGHGVVVVAIARFSPGFGDEAQRERKEDGAQYEAGDRRVPVLLAP